ncbi:MAG TPA: VWA domain-containing protein [Vicinamibacterales bacterium]|jgi:VWFA-related protein
MRFRVTVASIVAAASAILAAQQQPAAPPATQSPQPAVTFRVEVNYVEVDAIVTDAQGRVVSNLSESDFEVLEDGKPQKISSFSLVNIPIERAERPIFTTTPIEADVQTNAHAEGRIYLIVLDDVHTDFTRTPRVKASMKRFLEQNFGTNDLAAVVFTGRSEASQDFTNNTRLLLNAVDKFVGRKLRSATLTRIEGARANPDTGQLEPGDDIDQMDRSFRARSVMNNIRKLSEFMAGVRGRRKALLLIGEGVDYDIYSATGVLGATASSVLLDTQDAIAAATRGNVAVYAIDPRGLTSGDEDLIQTSSTIGDADGRAMQSELRLSQDSLRVLASSTGGFAAVNRNDLNGAFDRIVSENSSYYVFGYYSPNERRDGRFRKIQVRVKPPGLMVRSRNGYYEARGRGRAPKPSESTSAPLAEAIGSPLPVTGVPMKVFAAAYKGQAPNAAIAYSVEVDVNNFDFIEKDSVFNEELEVLYTSTDSKGKTFPGEKSSVKLTMKPDTYARVKSRGFRVVSQASLPPGRYQIRFAASNKTGKTGSVLYDLEVPDFATLPFSMSGVSITSRAAGETVTIRPKNPLGDYLPGPPTTSREFSRDDEIALFAEFYENKPGAPAHMLDFKAEMRAEGGTVVRTIADQRSSTELQGGSGGYGFQARMPLEDLAPGLYVLHVEGQSRTKDVSSASRDIQIRIK